MSKVKLAPLPTSNATNAYDLLSDVCDVILDEPRRYNQRVFLERTYADSRIGFLMERLLNRAPACGTVGCVAGWAVTLIKGTAVQTLDLSEDARVLLGITYEQALELFSGDVVSGASGTSRHARKGILHIRRFQQRYADQLKATAVTR